MRLTPQLERLNGQPARSPRTRSLYVVGHDRLYRLRLTPRRDFLLEWSLALGPAAVNGPPTIAGDAVWFTVSEDQALWARSSGAAP